MKIDWSSLALVAVTTVVAAVSIVGIFSIGVVSLTTAASRTAAGRGGGLTRVVGFGCLGVAALIALYGIYLIIPAFH